VSLETVSAVASGASVDAVDAVPLSMVEGASAMEGAEALTPVIKMSPLETVQAIHQ
jgi:hypothetical protein